MFYQLFKDLCKLFNLKNTYENIFEFNYYVCDEDEKYLYISSDEYDETNKDIDYTINFKPKYNNYGIDILNKY